MPPALVPAADSGIEIVMPQMGESIFEGTITKWLKKAGDTVEKDEPLFEISTDKVDAEIPSPVAGVLTEIKAAEGETVQINTVVAVIGGTGRSAVAVCRRSRLNGTSKSMWRRLRPQARRRRSWPHRRWWIRIARSVHRRWSGGLRRNTTLICGGAWHGFEWAHHKDDISALHEANRQRNGSRLRCNQSQRPKCRSRKY